MLGWANVVQPMDSDMHCRYICNTSPYNIGPAGDADALPINLQKIGIQRLGNVGCPMVCQHIGSRCNYDVGPSFASDVKGLTSAYNPCKRWPNLGLLSGVDFVRVAPTVAFSRERPMSHNFTSLK